MMIKIPPENISEIFFPIDTCKIYWKMTDMDDAIDEADAYFGVVDRQKQKLFGIFKMGYNPVTNQQAYDRGIVIANTIFMRYQDDKFFEMKPINVLMSKDRAVVIIYLERAIDTIMPDFNFGWKAFLRITNSYNGQRALSYNVGFRYEEKGLYLAFQDAYFNVTIDKHASSFLSSTVISGDKFPIVKIEEMFREKIRGLRAINLEDSEVLPLFCKFLRINKQAISKPWDYDHYRGIVLHFRWAHRDETWYGTRSSTGYDFLLAILEFMEKHKSSDGNNIRFIDYDYMGGKWVNDFLGAIEAGRTVHEYIGKEYFEVVDQFLKDIRQQGHR